jgi:hypothetical protein
MLVKLARDDKGVKHRSIAYESCEAIFKVDSSPKLPSNHPDFSSNQAFFSNQLHRHHPPEKSWISSPPKNASTTSKLSPFS